LRSGFVRSAPTAMGSPAGSGWSPFQVRLRAGRQPLLGPLYRGAAVRLVSLFRADSESPLLGVQQTRPARAIAIGIRRTRQRRVIHYLACRRPASRLSAAPTRRRSEIRFTPTGAGTGNAAWRPSQTQETHARVKRLRGPGWPRTNTATEPSISRRALRIPLAKNPPGRLLAEALLLRTRVVGRFERREELRNLPKCPCLDLGQGPRWDAANWPAGVFSPHRSDAA
jgi:hypothetical protein